MSAILPYYLIANSTFSPHTSQHFGLEINSEDVLHSYPHFMNIRCPAGYIRQWRNLANENDSGSNLIYNGDNYEVRLDVQQFTPDELNVKIENGVIIIEGQHAEREDGNGFISRHFIRKYDIPENSDINRIQSTLFTDGILTIIIPVRIEQERVIPIQLSIPHAEAA